jgi:AhpC/TSA family
MSLQEQLDGLRAQSKTRIPPEAQAVMQRSIDELRASGMLSRVPKVGDRAPDFTLPNAAGQPVSLAGLLAKGPVVVSFYRGRW